MPSTFVENICLPFLRNTQNQDGGWGFQAGSVSRAEPTAWALIALLERAGTNSPDEAVSRAIHFLGDAQLPDGSWPSSPELREGSWVTAVVGLALAGRNELSENVKRGLGWLCKELPGEASLFHRVVRSVVRSDVRRKNVSQNDSLFGWSWTVGTASWVEPTSYAIMFLRVTPPEMRPAAAGRRLRIGETMLYDRMCPGGGWNCGNPLVYGVPGEPQVSSTVWALLALQEHPQQPEVQESLSWLEGFSTSIQSPVSLALATMAMNAYGRSDTGLGESLRAMYERNEILWTVPAVAWAALALSGAQNWLKSKSCTNSGGNTHGNG